MLGSLHVAGGVADIEGATEGVAVIEGLPIRRGSTVGGLPLLCLSVLAFFSACLQIICTVETDTLTCSAICRVVSTGGLHHAGWGWWWALLAIYLVLYYRSSSLMSLWLAAVTAWVLPLMVS